MIARSRFCRTLYRWTIIPRRSVRPRHTVALWIYSPRSGKTIQNKTENTHTHNRAKQRQPTYVSHVWSCVIVGAIFFLRACMHACSATTPKNNQESQKQNWWKYVLKLNETDEGGTFNRTKKTKHHCKKKMQSMINVTLNSADFTTVVSFFRSSYLSRKQCAEKLLQDGRTSKRSRDALHPHGVARLRLTGHVPPG